MKLNSIQTKVGGGLVLILLAILGISFTLSALQTRGIVREQETEALSALHDTILEQAQGVFSSLEIGTKGSLERGEMDVFDELVVGLGGVPGVIEVGLTNPQGVTIYSSLRDKIGSRQPAMNITRTDENYSLKQESSESYFMAHGHMFEPHCMGCHPDAEEGTLSGVLYVDFSLDKLNQEREHLEQMAAAGNRSSLISSLVLGLSCLIIIWLALLLMLRKLVVVPLTQVRKVLTDIGHGHLDERLNLTQNDELGETGRTLDALADSLQQEIVAPLQQLAKGDLTFEVTPHDHRDTLRNALKTLGEDLNQIIAGIQAAGEEIDSGSAQLSESAQHLSDGASTSAASVEEISSSMNQIGSQTNASAENARQASELATSARSAANVGSERMTEMIGAMKDISDAGHNISKIIKVIDEIAFQTNLLALNAAVEAARAGQHGKGFAVVAEEVRNLAARSAKAAAETAELIEGSVSKTANGSHIAERTANALKEIVNSIGKTSDLIDEISVASQEQAQGVSQINTGLQQIDQVIQQNTATAEESAATSAELAGQAAQLKHQLSRFILKNADSASRTPVSVRNQLPAAPSGWGQSGVTTPSIGHNGTLAWKDSFNTGISLMDKQHRRLLDLINQLFVCMKDGGDRMMVGQVVDELVDYTVTHFRAEEDLMRKHKFPGYEAHCHIHKSFIDKVSTFVGKLKSGERMAPADVYKFLKDWLVNHIEKEDRDGYGRFITHKQ
jgi:methyl-accepting chemotaxis protein